MEATGSVLANKYSEGYPGKRYYEGQRVVDQIETLVQDRAKALFGVEHANVQPYSGSPANLAVYFALLEPGRQDHGAGAAARRPPDARLDGQRDGHASGQPVRYEVDEKTHLIDYDEVRAMAKAERPRIIVAGATAYPRQFDFATFGEIARGSRARTSSPTSRTSRGLIVAGVHPDPAPYADAVMTTTHKTLRGPRGAMILCKEEHAEAIDKAVFPGLQGGPHENTIAGIGVALKEAATAEFRDYGRQIVANAKALAARAARARLRPDHGRHRQPPDPDRPDGQEGDRQEGREGARPRGHRRQLQHDPVRPAQAVQPERPAHRHAVGHDARHEGRRHAPDRPLDGRSDRRT